MITETLNNLLHQTAFFNLDWGNYVMIAVACFFLYLAIKHEFEPLLLVPIAFGMLLVNIYPDIMAEPYTDLTFPDAHRFSVSSPLPSPIPDATLLPAHP